MLRTITMLGQPAGRQGTCVPMQACGLGFSLSQRSSASRQGFSRLLGDLTVAEGPVRSLFCGRGGRICRSSGEYRLNANWEKRAALIQEEDHILHCLRAAVVTRWNNLPMEVQRELFASAASLSEPLHTAELKEQIARFLHSHKNV